MSESRARKVRKSSQPKLKKLRRDGNAMLEELVSSQLAARSVSMALGALRDVAAERRELDLQRRHLVAEARMAGASWSAIGGALGISAQGAAQGQSRA